MRKWLKVEKKKRKFFSYNHVNERHKKIDWTIRITFTVILLLEYFYNVTGGPAEKVWYFEIWFLMGMFIIVSEAVRAIMEWKYLENKKVSILTITQLVSVVIWLWLTFDFFGLF